MNTDENPYASPPIQTEPQQPISLEVAQAIRLEHLNHEAEIRSVGLLHCIVGGLFAVGCVAVLVVACVTEAFSDAGWSIVFLFIASYAILAVAFLALGFRVRQLKFRWGAILLSGLGVTHQLFQASTACSLRSARMRAVET